MTITALVPREPAQLPEARAVRIIEIRRPWLRPLLGWVARWVAWLAGALFKGLIQALQQSPRAVARVLLGS